MTARYLTMREAAAYAHVSYRTIRRAVKSGALVAGGTPGRRLILPEQIDAWIARRAERETAAC